MSKLPCVICGEVGHETVNVFGAEVQACPSALPNQAVMYSEGARQLLELAREIKTRGAQPGTLDELRKCVNAVLEERFGKPTLYVHSAHRPPQEDYVRVSIEIDGYTLEPAVEYRDGDDFDHLARMLELFAQWSVLAKLDRMKTAKLVGKHTEAQWPDRAWFCEVWQHGKRGFAQSVQPFGFPRNR